MTRFVIVLGLLAALGTAATASEAAFSGVSGKLAFVRAGDIYTSQPDGSGVTPLTSGPAREADPSWSPDGTLIAFATDRDDPIPGACTRCDWNVYTMRADGSDVRRVTIDTAADQGPAWSPDQLQLAFTKHPSSAFDSPQLWKIDADGTDEVQVSESDCDSILDPAWSSSGQVIAVACFSAQDVFLFYYAPTGALTGGPVSGAPYGRQYEPNLAPSSHAVAVAFEQFEDELDGFCPYAEIWAAGANLTNNVTFRCRSASPQDSSPAWSPDGAKIAFWSDRGPTGVYVMGADGSNPTFIVEGTKPDWQPIPVGYVRPRTTAPTDVPLVVAYRPCISANSSHGVPLAHPSCAPPVPVSDYLTLGTPDANGAGAKGGGRVIHSVKVGNPATSADEADVRIRVTVSDVRAKPGLSDFTDGLTANLQVQITDRDNTPSPAGGGPGTLGQIPLEVVVPCTATPDATVGATCAVATTIDSLVPNTVKEDRRSVWRLGQVTVYDAGEDGLSRTPSDNTAFLTQGLFIP